MKKLTQKQIELLKKIAATSLGGHRNSLTAAENNNGTRLQRAGLLRQKFVAYSGMYLFLTEAGRMALAELSPKPAETGK